MDCLFRENEEKALECYIDELKSNNLNPVIYASPNYNFNIGCIISGTPGTSYTYNHQLDGYIGKYKGIPVYIFNGLDAHTCCIMPDFNIRPF